MTSVDLLIVGGGVQGLVLLDRLTTQGYSCLLVTDSALGNGQTLHSHGLLNSGVGLLTGLVQPAVDEALAFAAERGLQLYGQESWFAILPEQVFSQLRASWDATNYTYEEVPRSNLPAEFQRGGLVTEGTHLIRLPGYNFPKKQLVKLLSEPHERQIIRAEKLGFEMREDGDELRVKSVDVQVYGTAEKLVISPEVVIVAAGAGTKAVIRQITERASEQLEKVKFSKVHMICVRAPRGALPTMNFLSMPLGLMVVAHLNEDHEQVRSSDRDYVTWYVSPMNPTTAQVDEAPNNAGAEVDPDVVQQGIISLLKAYPQLEQDAQREGSNVLFAAYAGYKQDVGDQPIVPLCESVEATSNVIVSLPSILANAWPNARRVSDILNSKGISPSGRVSNPDRSGSEVKVGEVYEGREPARWMSLRDFADHFHFSHVSS